MDLYPILGTLLPVQAEIGLLLPSYYLLVALAAALGTAALGAAALVSALALALGAEALAAGAEAAAGAGVAMVAMENKLNASAAINRVIIILRVSGGWW